MKFMKVSLVTSSLLLAGLAHGQENAKAIIEQRCGMCHGTGANASFVDDNGTADEANIKVFAAKMIERIGRAPTPEQFAAGATAVAGQMPPSKSMASKFTVAERATVTAYLKSLTAPSEPADESTSLLGKLKVEDGFKIEIFAKAPGARSLAVHPGTGIVFVGTGGFSDTDKLGRVHAIVPTSSGNKTVELARGLANPNGVALHGDDLYVAELTRIIVFKNAAAAAKSLVANPSLKPSFTALPYTFRKQSNHSWKYLAIGPDERIYVGVGANCNVCEESGTGASILSMDLNGEDVRVEAKGVRNTVGITFHPVTGELWFTDNGRDSLGNTLPSDELNVLKTPGQNFGFPKCFASNVTDPQFGAGVDCNSATFTKPVRDLGAHVAALGVTHYAGSTFPAKYQNQAFVAEHGSWDSTTKVGYRLSIVEQVAGSTNYSYRPFISGWADTPKTNWGRPVDVKNYIDGSLLLSDDHAGLVYRISPVAQ
jgi:glucose/arabinose dehydrogenase